MQERERNLATMCIDHLNLTELGICNVTSPAVKRWAPNSTSCQTETEGWLERCLNWDHFAVMIQKVHYVRSHSQFCVLFCSVCPFIVALSLAKDRVVIFSNRTQQPTPNFVVFESKEQEGRLGLLMQD